MFLGYSQNAVVIRNGKYRNNSVTVLQFLIKNFIRYFKTLSSD
jgi:hypothetical protein